MPIPRFPSDYFTEFCQFRMQKKELALEMKNLFHFPYSGLLTGMQMRPSDRISKATIKTLEQDEKHV